MTFTQFYFSLNGRITRSDYWLKFYLPTFVAVFLLSIISELVSSANSDFGGAIFLIFYLLILWSSLVAIPAKRWHDRGKSGWMTLILLIPVIGSIWMFVEMGFLSGTPGPNRFGEDPLGRDPIVNHADL